MGDPFRNDVEAGQAAPEILHKRERGPSGPASDIEDPPPGAQSEPSGDLGLLGCRAPALLPNILAEGFTADRRGKFTVHAGVLRPVELLGGRFAFR
jgi:hypothetical protein